MFFLPDFGYLYVDRVHYNPLILSCVISIGNDINDKDVMDITGITFCPSDAHDSIKAISDHILRTKGGYVLIRDLLDFIKLE